MTLYDLIPSRKMPPVKGIRWWWHLLLCIGITAGMGLYEYVTSPLVLFPFAYVFPVIWVTRYANWRWGVILSTAAVLWRIGMAWYGGFHYGSTFHIVNVAGLILALTVSVWFMHTVQSQRHTIELLRELLPICAHCKAIRDSKGEWHTLEDYMGQHAEARFTHGICPICQKRHFPDD